MTTEHYPTIVIGAGSGGMTAAIGLAGLGRQVALVEGNHVGGDCTNVGCVPSKTLIHLAAHRSPGMTMDEVLAEVIRKRNVLRDEETEEVQHLENMTFIRGWAKFTGLKTLDVSHDGVVRKLAADNIVISTGARPRLLEIPGLPEARTLTNLNLFDLTEVPRHLA
ncbi:MAG: FAD-dependent oxidoreductase, partial [Chloroflexi bacterium]|nr:FAD-dependent oxidoreductase [Chloroflexota bacterium]